MGAFFGAIHVKGASRASVKDAATEVSTARDLRCLIGPEINGWISVYPQGSGQDRAVGLALAELLDCDVLHLLLHDDDLVAYSLWRRSQLVDTYVSIPGYIDSNARAAEEEMCGRPEAFEGLHGAGPEQLRKVLRRGEGSAESELRRFDDLAGLLGITNAATCFEYLTAGETEGIVRWKSFEEIPADKVQQERDVRKALKAARKQKRAEGTLLVDTGLKRGARAVAVDQGFLLATSERLAGPSVFSRAAPPWSKPEPVPIPSTPCFQLVASDDGARVAIGGPRLMVCSSDGRTLLTAQSTHPGVAPSLNRDGSVVAYRQGGHVVVTRVDDGQELLRLGEGSPVLHPSSGQVVVYAVEGRICVGRIGGDTGSERLLSLDPLPGRALTPPFRPLAASITGLTPGGIEAAVRAGNEARVAGVQRQAEQLGQPGALKLVARLREGLESNVARQVQALVAIASGMMPDDPERISTARFTVDGHWLLLGTSRGLRVYDWAQVERSRDQMPTAAYRFESQSASEHGLPLANIYAIADARDGSILLGGVDGSVHRLELSSGRVQRVRGMIGEEAWAVGCLDVTPDGAFVGIVRWALSDIRHKDQASWQVWRLDKLTLDPTA